MTITLNWNPGANSNGQEVQYKKLNDSTWISFQTLAAGISTTTISGLDDNYVYVFRIINDCQFGGPQTSGIFEGIKFSCADITAIADGYNKISFLFPPLGGDVNKYDVKLLAADGVTVLTTLTFNPPFPPNIAGQFTNATASTNYLVQVIAYATGAQHTYSSTTCPKASVTTAVAPTCVAPSNITATIQ